LKEWFRISLGRFLALIAEGKGQFIGEQMYKDIKELEDFKV